MALRLSTGLVNALMDTGSFKEIFENSAAGASAGFYIDIYTGSQPATADDAATGTKLVTISNNSGTTGMTFEASAGSTTGELEKNSGETWSGSGAATGTAGWFRVYRKSESPSALSTTYMRLDGSVSTSGAQMNLGSLTITQSAPFTLSAAAFTLPRS